MAYEENITDYEDNVLLRVIISYFKILKLPVIVECLVDVTDVFRVVEGSGGYC